MFKLTMEGMSKNPIMMIRCLNVTEDISLFVFSMSVHVWQNIMFSVHPSWMIPGVLERGCNLAVGTIILQQ